MQTKVGVFKFAYWLVISADLLLGGAARLFENNEVVSVSGLPALNLTPEHALGILSEYYEKVGHDEDIRKRWEVLAEAASGTFRSDKKWLVVNPQLFRRAADFSELPAAKRPGYALCPGTKIFTVEVFDLLKNSAMHSEVWAI